MGCCCGRRWDGRDDADTIEMKSRTGYKEASFFGNDEDDDEQYLIDLSGTNTGQNGDEKYRTTETLVTIASTTDKVRKSVDGGATVGCTTTTTEELGTEEEEEDDDERSIEDDDYYLKYRPICSNDGAEDDDGASMASNSADQAQQTIAATRRQYEVAINRINGVNDSKRQLIYEYEQFKSTYYNMEHMHLGEVYLTRARRSVNMEQKKMFYYEALLHTYDWEQKALIKDEYNAFFRGLCK